MVPINKSSILFTIMCCAHFTSSQSASQPAEKYFVLFYSDPKTVYFIEQINELLLAGYCGSGSWSRVADLSFCAHREHTMPRGRTTRQRTCYARLSTHLSWLSGPGLQFYRNRNCSDNLSAVFIYRTVRSRAIDLAQMNRLVCCNTKPFIAAQDCAHGEKVGDIKGQHGAEKSSITLYGSARFKSAGKMTMVW